MKSKYLLASFLTAFTFCLISCKDAKTVKQEKEYKEATNEFERVSKELQEEQKKEFEETGGLSNNPKALNRMIEASKKMENSATGEEAKGAKVVRMFMETVQKDTVNLTNYQEGLIQATDFSSIKNVNDIDTLSEKVKTYQKANNTLTEKIKTGWEQSLNQNLENEGISEFSRKEFMIGFSQSMNQQKPHLITIRQTDGEICKAILEQHSVLKKYFGKWEWDATQGAPLFQDNAALERFNAQAIKVQQASTRQAEAQRKLIQNR